MLLAYRLVRLIETQSEKLADSTLKRLKEDEKTREYCLRVPGEDFRAAVFFFFFYLGE